MTVKILFHHKYPSIGAASKRIQNYEKGLNACGVETEVISIPPKYSHPFLLLFRPFDTLVNLIIKNNKTDVLFIYGFGWFSQLLIMIYGRFRKSKIVFELNEKPYSLYGGSRRDILLKYFGSINFFMLTRFVYPFVDGFVVISEPLNQLVAKYKSKKCKVIKIPIIVDYDYYQKEVEKPKNLFEPYFIHSATLNDHKDGIVAVFKSLAIVINDHKIPLHFYLTSKAGLPGVKAEIEKIIKENNIEDYIHILGEIDEELLLAYQKYCSFVVLNKLNTEQNRYNFATKIGEYLALGKPLITTRIGEVINYLTENESCFYIEENNAKDIANKMEYFLRNNNEAIKIGQNAKNICLSYFDNIIENKKLKDFFEKL